MLDILKELRNTNSTNKKLEILLKNKNNLDLQKLLQLTYDTVNYNYFLKSRTVKSYYDENSAKSYVSIDKYNLLDILNMYQNKLSTREVTGHAARDLVLKYLLNTNSEEEVNIAYMVLDRDLKLNIGKTLINKIWKNLIKKTPYMRCDIFNEKTASKISFPAILQLKADGRFTYAIVNSNNISFESRSGEVSDFPLLENEFKNLPDGVYVGELLVDGETDRSIANGLINSDNPPQEKIYMKCWDLISHEEFNDPKHLTKNIHRESYDNRLSRLKNIIENNNLQKVSLIDTIEVKNIQEALKQTSIWMNKGFEGSILKDKNLKFKDHTSNQQLKLKVEIELDVRITGFLEGTVGTVREKTFGSMTYATDDFKIQGSVSGFTQAQLELYNAQRENLIGKVFALKCNDILPMKDKQFHALSHPRFIELRNDKNTTDTLERALELKEMAFMLKEVV